MSMTATRRSIERAPRSRALVVAALAVTLVLPACAVGSSGDDDGSSKTTTLTVWSYKNTPTEVAGFKAQNALFEKAHPGVKVENVTIPGDQLDTKLLATAATKKGPDILFNNVVVDFPALAAAGVMADVTKQWNSFAGRSQFPDASVWKTTAGQVQTILPYNNLLGVFYNKTILDKLNIEPPRTLDEFTRALQTVEKSGRYRGLAESASDDPGGAWMFTPQLLSEGVNFCNFRGSAVDQAFARVEGWVKAGYVPKEAATWDQRAAWQQFTTGKYAFGINGNWNLGAAKELSFDWGTTQYPTGTRGSHVYPGGEGIAVGAFSKHKDLAWQYAEQAWLSKQGQIVNYKYTGQIPVRADVASAPEVAKDKASAPFVAATRTVGTWPNNEKTAQAQNAVGAALSGLVSGQLSARQAADQAIAKVSAALKAGGGSC